MLSCFLASYEESSCDESNFGEVSCAISQQVVLCCLTSCVVMRSLVSFCNVILMRCLVPSHNKLYCVV